MKQFRVLMVEDNVGWATDFLDLLKKKFLLAELPGGPYEPLPVFTHVTNQADAEREVAKAEREVFSFDLILLDLVYPQSPAVGPVGEDDLFREQDFRGMKWLPELRRLQPDATIVILTSHPEHDNLHNVVAAIRDYDANDFIPKTADIYDIIPRIRLAWENARRLQQLTMLEEEFRTLLRTRAARTYAEDVAMLLRRFKTSLHLSTERLKSCDPSAIRATADALKSQFDALNAEFEELTNLLNEGKERRKPVDVAGLVRQMLLLYRRMLDNVHAEVSTPNGTHSVVLTTFEGDLKIALHEVITNALYALEFSDTPALQRKLSVTVDKFDDGAVIRVRDNGGGFSNEAINCMFDRGYTSKGESHQGLGLYITKRMMSQIGGGVTVQNKADGIAEVELIVKNLGGP